MYQSYIFSVYILQSEYLLIHVALPPISQAIPSFFTMSSPHILIVGGGIGGLALAQGLRKHGISFTLCEQDLSATARAQGYRVRISEIKGAAGLRDCLDQKLWDLFENTCPEMTPFGGRFNALDASKLAGEFGPGAMRPPTGSPAAGETPQPPQRPGLFGGKAYNVDRGLLRSMLLLGQEDNIKFGKSFERYELTSTGVKAYFKDGSTEEGTLLVGADGVASRIRRQFLPNQRYVDTGCRIIYGKTPITPGLEARFPPEYWRGITVIQDQKPLTLFLEPMRFPKDASEVSRGQLTHTEDYIYWVLGGDGEHFPVSDNEFLSLSHRAAASLTMELTKHWNPTFQAVFELQNTEQTSPLRIISAKPERPEWTPSTRVTLLGDAIHASMPAGGVGAKSALEDAASLLKVIVEEGISEESMQGYIDHMWEDAVANIQMAMMGGQKLLGFKGFESAKEVEF